MKKKAPLLLVVLLLARVPLAFAAGPAAATATGLLAATATGLLPATEDSAQSVLEHSPRHGEFVDVARAEAAKPLRTWIVYPERKDKAGVVLVIHEIFGLSDWIRAVADAFAAEGFIAVAPDLISGLGPGGGGTDSVASRDDVVKLVRGLTPEDAAARLDAVHDWAAKIPSANGKVATVGFCWGGARSFAFAATQAKLRGAVVYYGSAPDSTMLVQVRAPVLGHYGGDDARVNATLGSAERILKAAGRRFEPHVYESAGHGFLRQQTLRDGANQRAAEAAWPRTIEFLRERLE